MGFNWDKEVHVSFKDKVSFELIEIRQHLMALEVRLNALVGSEAPSGKDTSAGRTTSDFSEVTEFRFYKKEALAGLEDIEGTGGDVRSQTMSLVEATYAVKSAAIAMRGYLMLLDQAGLSKDQKKLIKDLEYTMMAIMKLVQAVRILTAEEYMAAHPYFGIFLAAGYIAASMAYEAKVMGGTV